MKSDLTVKKLNTLFIPYLLISIGLCTVYTFLHWLLIIKLELFSIKDSIIEIFGPLGLSLLAYLVFFMRRIKILRLKSQNVKLPSLYWAVIWLSLSIPNIIAQSYLPKVVGKLTRLHNISDIDKHIPSKYYSLDKFGIDKNNIGINTFYSIGGKNSSDYSIYIYVVFPIVGNKEDSTKCKAFLGIKYFKCISNRLSAREKEENYNSLLAICQYEIAHNTFDDFTYLEKTHNNYDGKRYKDAIHFCSKYNKSSAPVLIPQKGAFEDRLGNQLAWIFISFAIGSVVWLLMILVPKVNHTELKRFESRSNKLNLSSSKKNFDLLT
ncbi:hypothetical protein D3C87_646220 [compost metagenome]